MRRRAWVQRLIMRHVVREIPCALVKSSMGPEILIADALLQQALSGDAPFASYGDGIFTMHAMDGDVSFGVCGFDARTNVWSARRSGGV